MTSRGSSPILWSEGSNPHPRMTSKSTKVGSGMFRGSSLSKKVLGGGGGGANRTHSVPLQS